MLLPRVIPCLLLKNGGLVKTVRFRRPVYVGDPINTIKILNEKEVDELVLLDIAGTLEGRGPNMQLIAEACSEAFVPVAYGGGITTPRQMSDLFGLGIEKVVVNTAVHTDPTLVRRAADRFGSQSIVVSIDAKRSWLGRYRVVTHSGRRRTSREPVAFAVMAQQLGAGEIFLTSVDRDGTMEGYDLQLIRSVSTAVDVPVVACGGASRLEDFRMATTLGGASAVAAGSMFVFQGTHRAVLLSFPTRGELEQTFAVHGGDH